MGNAVLLNVHLLWDHEDNDQNKLKTKESVRRLVDFAEAEYPGLNAYLVGDTNRVPENKPRTDIHAATIEDLASGLGTVIHPPGPTNVRWSGDAKGSELTYADFGIIIESSAP